MQNNNSKLNTILLVIIAILVAVGLFFLIRSKADQTPVAHEPTPQTQPHYSFSPLGTTYIGGQNWPPAVTQIPGAYSCMAGHTPMDDTVERAIGNRTYCITTHSEGAAGSTYTNYTYRTGATQIMFTLRFPQCGNYNDPQKTACETERANFSVDQLLLNAEIQ